MSAESERNLKCLMGGRKVNTSDGPEMNCSDEGYG